MRACVRARVCVGARVCLEVAVHDADAVEVLDGRRHLRTPPSARARALGDERPIRTHGAVGRFDARPARRPAQGTWKKHFAASVSE